MLEAIAHRGPDDAGTYVDHKSGVALGHNRLSIIDLTPGGHQPMVNARSGDVLTFNGEIFNFKEVRNLLESDGMDLHLSPILRFCCLHSSAGVSIA